MIEIKDLPYDNKSSKTNGMPCISLVTPAYNSEKTIAETIESVISNKYPNLDYLIVDGNSKDNVVAIAKEYGPAVRTISEADQGQSDAINKGFRLTKGDILGWLNADDVLCPDALIQVGRFFKDNPSAVAVYGDSVLIDEAGKVVAKSGVQPFDRWRLIHSRNFIEQQSCFFRRDAYELVGGLDTSLDYVMDWDLWIKLSKLGELVYLPGVLSKRRLTASNKTQAGGIKRLIEIYKMLHCYGATWYSPVMLNYLYETIASQAKWGSGLQGFFAKCLHPIIILPLRPWFNYRMGVACFGSYPNGDIPPAGAVVIPPIPEGLKLFLQFRPAPIKEISFYLINCRVNRQISYKIKLDTKTPKPVVLHVEDLNLRQFNLIEFSTLHSTVKYEQLLGKNVRVSANLKWDWI